MDELIRTKTTPPVRMGNQIRRDILLARLDGALHRRLTLIHAPAGYGKTSLLSQWQQRHQESGVRIAWLTLEKEDADLKRLTRYILLSIGGDAPSARSERLISTELPPRAALSAIVNRLMREEQPVVLVLDDLHHATNDLIVDFMRSLIRLAPPHCHFVIASRDYPWLGQSVLAGEDQLLELGASDLKFSVDETAALLGHHPGVALDSADLDHIFERTEGWPIALQLTALSLRRSTDHKQLLQRLGGSSAELARYLSEQVLMGLQPDMRDVVMRTALVDTLTGDIVNALCERNDGWVVLERLEQQGVFLTALSDDRRGFRYHQLFAEYLRDRLLRQDVAQFRALQHAAARWFASQGSVAQAVNHAILSEDAELLATIVEEAGAWRLIPSGLQDVAAHALEKLPEAILAGRPRLQLMRIYLTVKGGELEIARSIHDRMVGSAGQSALSADLWTEVQMIGDVIAEYENLPTTLDGLLARETLLRTLPASDHIMLGHFNESLGAKYYDSGRLERAIEPTLAAREHYLARGSVYSDLFTRFLEARIRHAQGRLKDSSAILASAREQIEDAFGDRSDLAANCAAFEAETLYDRDHLPEATALLEWSIPHMEQSDGWVDVYAAGYLTAARGAMAEGTLDEARAMLARARRLAQRRRLRQLELLSQLHELQLLLMHGQMDGVAQEIAGEIGLDALANDMAEASPTYRHVAIAAALCRAQLRLIAGDTDTARAELDQLRRWGSEHGAGRLLIDVNILLAATYQRMRQPEQAQVLFDEAVGMAMFQNIIRPFIDARRFVEPLLRATLQGHATVDRFRDQFLKRLSRSFSHRSPSDGAQTALSSAEVEVLTYLCQGYGNKEIARLIGMSPDTVKYRLKSLYKKMGVSRRLDAVALARERLMAVK